MEVALLHSESFSWMGCLTCPRIYSVEHLEDQHLDKIIWGKSELVFRLCFSAGDVILGRLADVSSPLEAERVLACTLAFMHWYLHLLPA
jgi:hypothetical protein